MSTEKKTQSIVWWTWMHTISYIFIREKQSFDSLFYHLIIKFDVIV